MGKLFGTDGVRGVAGTELSCQLAYDLGRAGAHVLTDTTHRPKILVGRDTRISGNMLEMALCAGICSTGATVLLVDVMPTPAISYLTRKYKADAGVVISASHNPMEFNGIKFFNCEGFKLSDELENQIEAIIEDNCSVVDIVIGAEVGTVETIDYADKDYIEYIMSLNSIDIKGMKIAIDCANGAASAVAPKLFDKMHMDYISIYDHPNGVNINADCGSTHLGELKKLVVDTKCDLGLAFDGDADRMLAVDEKGEEIDGDMIMAICAKQMKEDGVLNGDTLVATVMSNLGLSIFADKADINLERSKVGDRYVLELMKEKGYNLGGEQSGHVIFLDYNTTGDGILSGLKLMEALKLSGKKASELKSIMKKLPQVLVNVKVANDKKYAYADDKDIADFIDNLDKKYDGSGRVLVRPSGTEPKVRVMIEGENIDEITNDANALAKLMKEKFA